MDYSTTAKKQKPSNCKNDSFNYNIKYFSSGPYLQKVFHPIKVQETKRSSDLSHLFNRNRLQSIMDPKCTAGNLGAEELSYSPTLKNKQSLEASELQKSNENNPYYFNAKYIKFEPCKLNANFYPNP